MSVSTRTSTAHADPTLCMLGMPMVYALLSVPAYVSPPPSSGVDAPQPITEYNKDVSLAKFDSVQSIPPPLPAPPIDNGVQ